MDYAAPAVLFLMGFAVAMFASGAWKLNLRRRKGVKLPVEDGAVRLDRMATTGRKKAMPAKGGQERQEETSSAASAARVASSDSDARPARPRARQRR